MPNDTIQNTPLQEPTSNASTIPGIGGDTEEQLIALLQDTLDEVDTLKEKVEKLEEEMQQHGQNLEAHKQQISQDIQQASKQTTAAVTQHINTLLQ